MPTRETDIQARPLVPLALIALFTAMVVSLPIGHQFFHASLIEPEHRPVHLLQTGLVLLGGAVALVVLTACEPASAIPCVAAFPFFSPRFTCPTRGPPRR